MNRVYLDNNATTKIDEEVLNAMLPYLQNEYGNPSSIYSLGTSAKKAVEEAREKVALSLNADPSEIYFTASGSESSNMAIRGLVLANKHRGNHIITSKIEHYAVLETCQMLEKEGFKVTYLDVDEHGIVNLEQLKKEITSQTILITIMYANNEIGTIQPIEEIGKIAKENNVLFHTDAVQAVGSIKIDVQEQNIDLLSLSAHKIYGPKGVGALYVRKGINFNKIIMGGHQERDKRAGTENVAGIVRIRQGYRISVCEFRRKKQTCRAPKRLLCRRSRKKNSTHKNKWT